MAGISIVSTTLTVNNPMVRDLMSKSLIPIPIQFAVGYAGIFITLLSGFFMLQGKAWARILYVIWGATGLVIGLLTSPMKTAMIPGLVVYVVISLMLFRPAANSFFSILAPSNNDKGL
jgi:hypothetical protein